ncbi:MAG: MFS transporter [Solirubrobacteraceae bacterium]
MARKWWTLIVVCVATFMLLLDVTIVNVALPSIQRSLHSSFADLQWVVDAYSLTLAAFLLTAGGVSDILGRRRVFGIGLVVFTIASALCGLAGSAVVLNFSRGLQGIGAAMMFATSLALIAQEFSGRDRGTAFGIWGAATGAAIAIGPLIGGLFTDAFGWQSIFFLNVPIGIAALTATLTKLVNVRPPGERRIDWGGLVTFSAALFMLVFALVRGNDTGWGSTQIVSLLAGSVVLLVVFYFIERTIEHPMFDLSLFNKPTFTGASIVAFTLSASMFAMFLYLTLYIQGILNFSPLQAGLRFLPQTLVMFAVAPIAGKLSARLPVRALMGFGLVLVGGGLLLMHGLDAGSTWTALLPGFIISGVGIGMINPPLASTAVGVVEPQHSGMAGGINTTFRQVGIATGVAALGAVFQHAVQSKVVAMLAGTTAAGHSNVFATAVYSGAGHRAAMAAPAPVRPLLDHVARVSFTSALNEILLIGVSIALIGAVLGFVLIRTRDFVVAPGAEAAVEAPVAA